MHAQDIGALELCERNIEENIEEGGIGRMKEAFQ